MLRLVCTYVCELEKIFVVKLIWWNGMPGILTNIYYNSKKKKKNTKKKNISKQFRLNMKKKQKKAEKTNDQTKQIYE